MQTKGININGNKVVWAFEIIAMIITYAGNNILQISYRTLVLDIIPIEHQHPCALMMIVDSSLSKIIICFIFAIVHGVSENGNDEIINKRLMIGMYAFAMVFVFISVLTTFFTATENIEEEQIPLKEFVIDCFRSLKNSNKYTIKNWIILLLGWIANVSFLQLNSQMFTFFSYANSEFDDQYKLYSISSIGDIQSLILAIIHLIYSIILFSQNTYPWYLMWISNLVNAVMYLIPMFLVIWYVGFDGAPEQESSYRAAIIGIIICQVIMIVPNAISSAQLLSVPFAVLKNIVDNIHFGLYVGLFNSAIIVAQIIAYLTTYFLFKNVEIKDNHPEESLSNSYRITISEPTCVIISSIIPVIFYFISSFASVKIKKAYKQRVEYRQIRQNVDDDDLFDSIQSTQQENGIELGNEIQNETV